MGQQSLILAFLASFLLGTAMFSFMEEWRSSTRSVATTFEEQQALNVANSGINLAASYLRQNRDWRTGFTGLRVCGGLDTLRVVNVGFGADTVRITSSGRYGASVRRVVVLARLASVFPTVQSALAVYGDTVAFSNSGKSFLLDGNDYLQDGVTKGTAPPVWGLGVQQEKIVDYLQDNMVANGVTTNVIGKNGTNSIGEFNADSLKVLRDMYKNLATITLPPGKYSGNAVYGTLTAPEIVYIPGDLNWSGTVSGAGILVVDGQLELYGKISWKGIIIALAGGVTLDLGASGTPDLLGTTMIGNDNPMHLTSVKVNGNPSIKYSYETIVQVLANLDLLRVKILSYYE